MKEYQDSYFFKRSYRDKAFANAIDTLNTDQDLCNRYAAAAKKRIEENFTKEKAVAVMMGLYEELLS